MVFSVQVRMCMAEQSSCSPVEPGVEPALKTRDLKRSRVGGGDKERKGPADCRSVSFLIFFFFRDFLFSLVSGLFKVCNSYAYLLRWSVSLITLKGTAHRHRFG